MTVYADRRYKESVNISFPTAHQDMRHITESFGDDLPLAIFPEVHVITADKVTKNYTYYSAKSLKGKPEKGTGLVSFYYPYNIPILRDHMTHPGFFGGFSSDPYGRIYHASFKKQKSGSGWVKAVSAITDPWAIEMVLTKRFQTVSLGSETEEVKCSICVAQMGEKKAPNMIETGRCDHYRGDVYDEGLCYWMIGPIKAQEVSFVNQPADDQAGVTVPDLGEAARALIAGTDGEMLLDMATGMKESADQYRTQSLSISKDSYARIMQECTRFRKVYEYVVGDTPKLGNLTADEDKVREIRRAMIHK